MPPPAGTQPLAEDISKSLRELSIKQREAVADSWEDDASSEEAVEDDQGSIPDPASTSTSTSTTTSKSKALDPSVEAVFTPDGRPLSPQQANGTSAPPNTPDLRAVTGTLRPGSSSDKASTRPEKTVAPAARMIAGALGVKAPKRTEEQRAYDAAVRKQETKRRDEERERAKNEEMEREKAKKDIWDG